MEEELNTGKQEQEPNINAPELLDWVSKNAVAHEKEVKEKLNDVNITYGSEGASYDSVNEVLYFPKDVDSYVLTHELVHLISHHNRGEYHKQRIGIQEGMFDVSPNEALTELSTFIMFKGSEYIQSTQYSEIIQEYRRMSPAEPGYLYATQYLFKKIKERNLDSKDINHIVSTYLFKEGIASSVKDDIEMMLGIEDIDKDIKEFQNEMGQKLLESAWGLFRDMERADRWDTFVVPLGDNKVTLGELFKPFEMLLNQKKLNIFWSINSGREEFLKSIERYANSKNSISLISIDATLLYILLRERNNPEILKTLKKYFVSKALNLYKVVNSKKEE